MQKPNGFGCLVFVCGRGRPMAYKHTICANIRKMFRHFLQNAVEL